ncbi:MULTISPECIES: GNAT family N-acetyltransferase [Spirulina sp. CCY15215]|uniref:GNAT family N-acetyltransferase n=1 Tax=Spirulina sp. CCY15215 TaxID=2767591 RepID=UPI00194E1CF0|nr:GNAT family N-acetyltransferase [Spirulina major]
MGDRKLPENCLLRRALREDIGAIRRLVWGARLDPTQLRWQQFWVIARGGEIIACGQLRIFKDAQELGSLVVARGDRDRGLGRFLSRHLIQEATKPLYLECVGGKLAAFYEDLGFVAVKWEELPRSLKFKFALSQLAKVLVRLPVTFMFKPNSG